MQERSSNRTSIVAIIAVAVAIMMLMFQMNDPYMILMPCILVIWSCLNKSFSFSSIDLILICICIYDVINWYIHPSWNLSGVYSSVICFCCYVLLRSTITTKEYRDLFLKVLVFPTILALVITFVSFCIFIQTAHEAGFINTYPVRFLFRPLGYVITVLSSIFIPLLGLLSIGYYQIPRWRSVFCLSGIMVLIAILISFSRAAYIACIVYALFILIIIKSTKKKIAFLALFFGIVGTVWLLFPVEVSTTLAMDKTISQRQSTEGRINSTEKALEIFKENKWIGTGDKTYSLTMDKAMTQDSTFAFTPYPPNMIVQLLIEKGIIGVVLYAWLGIAVILILLRQRKEPITLLSCGCLLSWAIKEMTISSMLNDTIVWLLVFILIAFLQVESKDNKNTFVPFWSKCAFIVFASMCFISFEISNLKERSDKESTHNAIRAFRSGHYLESLKWLEKTSGCLPCQINRAMFAVNVPHNLLPASYRLSVEKELKTIEFPADIYIFYIQAKLMFNGGKEAEAYQIFKTLTEKYPRNASYAYSLYQSLYKKEEQEEAALSLAKALCLYPRLLHTDQIKEVFCTDINFKEKVYTYLKSDLIRTENTPNAYARYGYLSYYINEKNKAKIFLEKTLELQPGFAVPWLLLGNLYHEDSKIKEAKACYKKYNLLIKGVYTNNELELEEETQTYPESKVLFERYSKKFSTWYGCNIVF